MKRNILTLMAAAILFASCASHYVVTDNVSQWLNGTRTVLTTDTTSLSETPYGRWERTALDKYQVFDFRTEHDTMRYAYSQTMPCDGWTIMEDSLSRMMRPQVTVIKHFRWFTTRYCYSAVFPALDSLPVPISEYLTDEEQQLLFQPLDLPSDWNGADMYALLDKLNTKYIKWWSHCFFEKEYEIYFSKSDSTQRLMLAQYHDTLLALVQADIPEDKQVALSEKARLFPELAFVTEYQMGYEIQAVVMAWYDDNCELENRVLWRVELPGGRTAEYMVSTERLITGDYTVELHSDVLNWWAIAITLLLALAFALWIPCRRSIIA